MGNKIRVALVDDHSAVRAGFRLLLESSGEVEVVAEMDDGEAINQQIGTLQADLIVMDLSMRGMGGLEAIKRVRLKNDRIKILVFTMHDNVAFVDQALEAGANGYITKSNAANVLVEAIKQVITQGSWIEPKLKEQMTLNKDLGVGSVLSNLSRREFQIFGRLAQGLSAQAIADELSLSVKTVANYQTQIKDKLGVHTTADLVKLALANGVIQM
ncbi:MAG TPA: response regulator transcription factor [Pseudomonadaceae bacterium]|nr:response regulator transcription factor [Pseudomonadaceae bacterium]